jgi:hypothetical protein
MNDFIKLFAAEQCCNVGGFTSMMRRISSAE